MGNHRSITHLMPEHTSSGAGAVLALTVGDPYPFEMTWGIGGPTSLESTLITYMQQDPEWDQFERWVQAECPYMDLPYGWTPDPNGGPSQELQWGVVTLVNTWAVTSADHQRLALAMQLGADREWQAGLTEEDIRSYHSSVLDVVEGVPEVSVEQITDPLRVFLRAQYRLTQQTFRERGIRSVILYRGMTPETPDDFPDIIWDGMPHRGQVRLRPLSSFTVHEEVALAFAQEDRGIMIRQEVPVEQILSIGEVTGLGTHAERECVVIGGQDLPLGTVRGWGFH